MSLLKEEWFKKVVIARLARHPGQVVVIPMKIGTQFFLYCYIIADDGDTDPELNNTRSEE